MVHGGCVMFQFGNFRYIASIHRKGFNISTPAVICGLIIAIVGDGIGVMIHSNHRYLILITIIGIMDQIADLYDVTTAIWLYLEGFNMLSIACLGIMAIIGQYVCIGINLQQVLLIYGTRCMV